MPHGPTASMRGNKFEEDLHRPWGTNTIGTLHHNGVWITHPHGGPFHGMLLNDALTHAIAQGHNPLLWAYVGGAGNWRVKFGFDVFVAVVPPPGAPAPAPGAMAKIGHVALENQATISGEIAPDPGTPNGWVLDNNSGAWGAMDNRDGKSIMLAQVATAINAADAVHTPLVGQVNCRAKKAYSRKLLKRSFQQTWERLGFQR